MNFKINDESKIPQERYIELKQKAYNYYEQYNSLDRKSRKSFLDTLPEMSTPFETAILRNTLLFPDTEELLMAPKGALYRVLNKITNENDDITKEDMMAKYLEYSMQQTQILVKKGFLKVMDNISYPDNSINVRDYISLKKEALDISDQFMNLSLRKKVRFILRCAEEKNYQSQIQVSTLLIPNDTLLMKQLEGSSINQLANLYGVPSSLIEFKKEEYEKQDTSSLITQGKFTPSNLTQPWYKDGIDEGMINQIWNQSFYQKIEQEYISNANSALENMFGKSKKVNK